MKIKKWISICLLSLSIGILLTSCEKESEGIMIRMRNADNGKTILSLVGGSWVISGANNFELYSFGNPIYDPNIVKVGKYSGLQDVENIPSSGWAYSVAVEPKAGYIVKCGNSYSRLWVEDWIESTSGGIIGAIVYYEKEWQ